MSSVTNSLPAIGLAEKRKFEAACVKHAYRRRILEEGIPVRVRVRENGGLRVYSDEYLVRKGCIRPREGPCCGPDFNNSAVPCICTCRAFPHESHKPYCRLLKCMYTVIRDGACKPACANNFRYQRIVCGCPRYANNEEDYSCGKEVCPNPFSCQTRCSGQRPCSPYCTSFYAQRCVCVKQPDGIACEKYGCPNSLAACGCYRSHLIPGCGFNDCPNRNNFKRVKQIYCGLQDSDSDSDQELRGKVGRCDCVAGYNLYSCGNPYCARPKRLCDHPHQPGSDPCQATRCINLKFGIRGRKRQAGDGQCEDMDVTNIPEKQQKE